MDGDGTPDGWNDGFTQADSESTPPLTLDAFQEYLQEFPSGLFTRDARQRITELELLQREEEAVAARTENVHGVIAGQIR